MAPDAMLVGAAVILGLTGILTPAEVFAGLTNQGMLTVAALFVVAAGVRETGALEVVGRRLLGNTTRDRTLILRLAGPTLGMSAFLNNTPVVAMLMNVVTDWCRRHRVSPSRLLLPLSYLAILGGTCTLIGTSTNLVVDGMMRQRAEQATQQAAEAATSEEREQLNRTGQALHGMSLFELSWLGIPGALAGVLFLVFVGRRLLPDRKNLLERLGASPREYLVDMIIEPGCRLINQRVDEAGLRQLPGLFLIEVNHAGTIFAPVGPDYVLQEGDRLTFTGVVSTIVDLERIPGLVPAADAGYESHGSWRKGRQLCEAVISTTSPLVGRTIRDTNFRALYNAAIVAVHRGGQRLKGRIGDIVLQPGDTLLLQAGAHFNQAHRNNPDFYLVSPIEESRPLRHERAPLAFFMVALLAGLMVSGLVSIVMAAFLVAGLMILTRCISTAVARKSVDWQVLLTIAGALAVATALRKTGVAETIAALVVSSIQSLGPRGALLAVFLITMVFTELITNNAAAALIFPFAIAVAEHFGVSPRPFAVIVMYAASASFITPIGYQTNLMVFGPGGYKVGDFVRVGLPLSLLLCGLATLLVPMIWPF
jgi:di/tricarboxylate transporter